MNVQKTTEAVSMSVEIQWDLISVRVTMALHSTRMSMIARKEAVNLKSPLLRVTYHHQTILKCILDRKIAYGILQQHQDIE